MKTALLFGSSGLIGGHLTKQLIENSSYSKVKLFVRSDPKINDPKIEGMLETIGWSRSFKKLDKIDYTSFRQFFAGQLPEYFKEKNPEDSDTIRTYVHILSLIHI